MRSPWSVGALGIVVLAVGLAVWVQLDVAHERAARELEADLERELAAGRLFLESAVQQVRDEVRFAADLPPVPALLRARDHGGVDLVDGSSEARLRDRLAQIFEGMLARTPLLYQARLIDLEGEGREWVRIERAGHDIVRTATAALQAKGHRDYVATGRALEQGRVWISELDLNREHGEIERPLRPTLRAVSLIRDAGGTPRALVVVNAEVPLSRMFDAASQRHQFFVTDAEGHYLLHPDARLSFGHELGAPRRWAEDFAPAPRVRNAVAPIDGGPARVMSATHVLLDESGTRVLHAYALSSAQEWSALRFGHARDALSGIFGVLLSIIILGLVWLRALRAETKAQREQRRLGGLLEATLDAVIGLGPDGRVRDWNPAAERLFGFSASAARGRDLAALLDAPELAGLERRDGRADASCRRDDGARMVVAFSSSPIWAPDGSVLGAAVTARDESAVRLRAERADVLEESLLGAAGLATFTMNADGLLTSMNRAAAELLGYAPEQLVRERSAFSLHDATELRALADAEGIALTPGLFGLGALIELEIHAWRRCTLRHRDGRPIPVRKRVAQLRGHDSYVGVLIDETERVEHEAVLAEARVAAEAATRAKSSFLANMSHEIRTPMNAVLGNLQLLARDALDARARAHVHGAESAGRTLLRVIDDVLDFSKIEAGKVGIDSKPFRLQGTLRDIGRTLATQVAPEVRLFCDLEPQLPDRVAGDELRLNQVLVNLGSNALRFTRKGWVRLEVRVVERTGSAVRLSFAVHDTGRGMSDEQLARVFESFEQAESSTSRNHGGTGLGLSIARELVHLMGGQLAATSAPGKGSSFSFTIELGLVPGAGAAFGGEALEVLGIDTDSTARRLHAQATKALGWSYRGFERLEEAEGHLVEAEPPEVLVVDARPIPGEALAFARRARAHLGAHLTILMTGLPRHEALLQQLDPELSVVDGYVTDPFTPSSLYDAVIEHEGRPVPLTPERGPRLEGMRLLLVEDTPMNQRVARELLELEGAEVCVAPNGRAALLALEAEPESFDMVLMDIQMPGMNGFQTTRAIRGQLGLTKLPIVAMTAHARPEDYEACKEAGMNDHIPKPIHIDRVVATLRDNLGRPAGQLGPQLRSATSDLELIEAPPDFDFEAAVTRVGGRESLLLRQLEAFASEYSGFVLRLNAALTEGDAEGAIRMVHSLKSLAGSLGGLELMRSAGQLEDALREGSRPSRAPGALQDCLQRALTAFSAEAERLRARMPVASEAEAASVAPCSNAVLDQLRSLLERRSLDALALFDAESDALHARDPDAARRLEPRMRALDFSAALETVGELLNGSRP